MVLTQRYTNQCNRIERPETNPCVHQYLIYDKAAIAYCVKENILNK